MYLKMNHRSLQTVSKLADVQASRPLVHKTHVSSRNNWVIHVLSIHEIRVSEQLVHHTFRAAHTQKITAELARLVHDT